MIDRDKVARDVFGSAEFAGLADAAIAAVLSQLREPSDAMLAAGEYDDYTHPDEGPGRLITREMARHCWQAMIDAAFPTGDAAAALARTKRAIEELAATLDEVDAFRDAAKPQPSADASPRNPHT